MQGHARATGPAVVVGGLLLAALFVSGCADPTVAYHRQFEYLRRVGGEALEQGRLDEAREHLLEASQLAQIAAVTDLEQIDALTLLTGACREQGRLGEAVGYANAASQVLARYRLAHGGASSGVYRVGAAYLLERGRLEIDLGNFIAAETALRDFIDVRGDDGGDASESSEAQLLLGELRLARGLEREARAAFRASLDQARTIGERAPALFGFALFRVAELKLAKGRAASAAALIEESRPDGVAVPALRPGLVLIRGLVDASQGNLERAAIRLEEGIDLLASRDPELQRDLAAPARAIVLAGRVFDPAEDRDRLAATALRALATAHGGSPLRQMQAGRQAAAIGRALRQAGAGEPGIGAMIAARAAISEAVGGRAHDALVETQFEIVTALEQRNRLAAASQRCDWLVDASDRLSARARALQPERLLSCGRIAAHRSDLSRARRAFGRALMIVEQDAGPPGVRIELFVRLAALAHQEEREVEEDKLFDRLLAFVLPGVYDHLETLLVDAYAPYGSAQPSSAAARLAHSAARSYAYAVEAPQLQLLAERLSEPVPAAR